MATADTVRSVAPAMPQAGYRVRRFLSRSVVPRAVLVIGAIVFMAPLYWMLVSALKTPQELTRLPPTLIPETFVWQNFIDAVTYIPFGTFALNSLLITLGITIGSVFSNTLVAYGFSRIQWPGRDKLFYLCLATIFLPYPVILVGLFDIFSRLPAFGFQGSKTWINTFLPLVVPAFLGNPFYIFLMRQFMLGIPRELTDAAKVDGANEFQVFRKVILPLTRPAVTVVAIFAAVAAWNEFLLPLLYLHEQDKYPLAIGLAFFTSERNIAYNLLMAASALVMVPVVILFLVGQRFFVEGVTVGGVKG
jgi:multiple sugar transport system permease protein